jgi:hypothetical protein
MGKPSAPRPPDPRVTAQAQTDSNRDTAVANSYLNNVNQNTPYGSVTYDITGTGPNGVPRWTQTTTESANQAELRGLQEQQGIQLGQLGISQTGRVSDILGTNYTPRRFDTNSVTGGPLDIAGALGDYGSDVEARTRELATRGLGRDFDQREESLRSRLANQGVNAGTEAFDTELRGLGEQRGEAFANAELMARSQAQSDRQQSLSELLGQRGTNLTEQQGQYSMDTTADLAARQNPLNEIIALMSGVQTNPINPGMPQQGQMNGTDVAGIYQNNYANQMAGYQQEMAGRNALLGSLAQLGGAAIGASDRRVKRDIEYSHTDDKGRKWWTYNYVWDDDTVPRRTGVMAQELLDTHPSAVMMGPGGYYLVDYAAL